MMFINFSDSTLPKRKAAHFQLTHQTTTSYRMLTLTWLANNNLSICPATKPAANYHELTAHCDYHQFQKLEEISSTLQPLLL